MIEVTLPWNIYLNPLPLPPSRDSCFYWCWLVVMRKLGNIPGTCYSFLRLQVNRAEGVVDRLERTTLQLASCLDTIDILGSL